jgi:hypothetical protein
VHVTSPNPVRNAELMAALRRVLHRPAAPPTPALLARLGAALLRTDPAVALTGRRCVPGRLQASGFEFRFPDLIPLLRTSLRPMAPDRPYGRRSGRLSKSGPVAIAGNPGRSRLSGRPRYEHSPCNDARHGGVRLRVTGSRPTAAASLRRGDG